MIVLCDISVNRINDSEHDLHPITYQTPVGPANSKKLGRERWPRHVLHHRTKPSRRLDSTLDRSGAAILYSVVRSSLFVPYSFGTHLCGQRVHVPQLERLTVRVIQ